MNDGLRQCHDRTWIDLILLAKNPDREAGSELLYPPLGALESLSRIMREP